MPITTCSKHRACFAGDLGSVRIEEEQRVPRYCHIIFYFFLLFWLANDWYMQQEWCAKTVCTITGRDCVVDRSMVSKIRQAWAESWHVHKSFAGTSPLGSSLATATPALLPRSPNLRQHTPHLPSHYTPPDRKDLCKLTMHLGAKTGIGGGRGHARRGAPPRHP